ncbi:hypothetical protein GLAREA_01544 [Glarea lozoyensis ATCC 20868]|uniref:Uncharacterized protein n=1 Tax=Glarea lozoyensis (strain ATCC 20868 / MF5171) TaxID=1116229 RepID=S3CGJ2_GLAL2|nr:uncharacterized protein GLAREA_01544 [Glarea lozoyensis ATCC 20868]EPE25632.1 hypothetical protein GLAREA_01544 [Glarea lozoyensis ATCC 20868]
MSGSGGYYKYRCKYFFTHNCPHWVWADGRDSAEAIMPSPFRLSREVYVPQFENGALQYIMFEIISNSETDSGWTIKEQPKQGFPTATGPSAAQTITAFEGLDSQKKNKIRTVAPTNTTGWGRINFE